MRRQPYEQDYQDQTDHALDDAAKGAQRVEHYVCSQNHQDHSNQDHGELLGPPPGGDGPADHIGKEQQQPQDDGRPSAPDPCTLACLDEPVVAAAASAGVDIVMVPEGDATGTIPVCDPAVVVVVVVAVGGPGRDIKDREDDSGMLRIDPSKRCPGARNFRSGVGGDQKPKVGLGEGIGGDRFIPLPAPMPRRGLPLRTRTRTPSRALRDTLSCTHIRPRIRR